MSQIFHRSSNAIARASLAAVGAIVFFGGWAVLGFSRSAYNTGQGVTLKQPVPFSHEHHVRGLGIDCRYCHTGVERSAVAGVPPTQTCMNCHRLIWKDSPMLAPVRESFRSGQPIEWARVHDLPDFVFFNHSIHVAKGVGCATCHGRVDLMAAVQQVPTLRMSWCLDCHRNPGPYLRPLQEIASTTWERPHGAAGEALARELARRYAVAPRTSCTTCHR